MDEDALLEALGKADPAGSRTPGGRGRSGGPARLLAYPGQSKFTGVQHPLRWIEPAHRHGFDVLLDAAAFLPTNPLRLDRVKPDFVAMSWYKVFGYPTGVGCLVASREALARLRRPWFSGGTIVAVSVQADWQWMTDDETAFEVGTVNFLSIPDVPVGLSWIQSIGITAIQARVRELTGELLARLGTLRHTDGRPMVRIYGPTDTGGAVRVSLGIASNRADLERFVDFLERTYRDRPAVTQGLPPRLRC